MEAKTAAEPSQQQQLQEEAPRSAVPLSSDAQVVIQKDTEDRTDSDYDVGFEKEEDFEIKETVQIISKHGFKKVALQFPDRLLPKSSTVYEKLKQLAPEVQFFILGDTSYGACCVDEVAAEHIRADLIVHYGPSCLSLTSRLPVYFVFGRKKLDSSQFFAEFRSKCPLMGAPGTNPETDKERRYLFFYDVGYHHLVAELEVLLRIFGYVEEVASFTAVDKFYQPPTRTLPKSEEEKKEESESCGDCSGCSCSSTSSTHTTSVSSGTMSSGSVEGADETRAEERIVFGRKFKLQAGTSVKDYTIIYIGDEGRTLTNLVIHFNHNEFLRFSPKTSKLDKETLQVNRTLSKRYFLVEKTKDADIIGIVVGTLGVDKYLDIIEHLKLVIKDAGKKHYLLAVGKLNPAKLANFEHVDIFVLVACPENSLVDSKDFYKPIVTPFELEVALVKGKKWTGDFVTDFRHVLPGLAATDKEQEEEEEDSEGEDSPRFSLIDGKLKASKAQEAEATQGKELANVSTERGLVQVKSAADHLSTREWKGLEQKLGETPVALAVEGRSGLPKGYTHEPSAKE